MNNQSQFFYSHSSIDIQKKTLFEKETRLQYLKFLILIMQIIYLFNIQWAISSSSVNQPQIIRNICFICEGILVFITITIYLIWVTRNELFSESINPVEQSSNRIKNEENKSSDVYQNRHDVQKPSAQ
jgi:hypothetical protein